MRNIRFATGQNFYDPTNSRYGTGDPKPKTAPAVEVLEALTQHQRVDNKVDVIYLTPGHFTLGNKRRKALATGGDIFLFDFDGQDGKGEDNYWIVTKLRQLREMGISYGAATSFSHGRKSKDYHSRCRISIVADRTVTPDEWLKVWLYWADFFDGRVDRAPQHLAAIFHSPACPKEETREWSRLHIAEVFDVGSCLTHDLKLTDVFEAPTRSPVTRSSSSSVTRSSRNSLAFLGDKLERATPIELSDGSVIYCDDIGPDEKHPCRSPWRNDDNPSAFIASSDGGVFCHDTGDGVTRWFEDVEEAVISELFAPTPEATVARSDFSLLRGRTCNTSGNKNIKYTLKTGQYLSDVAEDLRDLLPYGGLEINRSAMGRGKTERYRQIALEVERVMAISADKALCRGLAARFRTGYYTDRDPNPERVTTTINSLPKFSGVPEEGNTWRWDLTVVDELPLVLKALFNKTTKLANSQTCKEILLQHLAYSRHAAVSAADLTDAEIQWVIDAWKTRRKAINPNDPCDVVIIDCDPIPKNRTLRFVASGNWEAEVSEAIENGGKIGIQETDQECGLAWTERAKELNPNKSIWWISSKNSQLVDIQRDLGDPRKIQEDHDIVICSPSVKAGVSFDLPVEQVFIRISADLDARSVAQMVQRFRHVDKEIVVCFSERRGDWNTDPAYITQLTRVFAKTSQTQLDEAAITYRWDYTTGQKTPSDTEMFSLFVQYEQERRLNANNSLAEFLKQCKLSGWAVIDDRETEPEEEVHEKTKAQKREAKKVVKANQIKDLLDAPRLDQTACEELEKKQDLSAEEALSLHRAKTETFYGQDLDKALAEWDYSKKSRQKVRAFARLSVLRDTPEAIYALDASATDVTGMQHIAQKTKLQAKLLLLITGETIDNLDGVEIKAEDYSELVSEYLGKHFVIIKEILKSSIRTASIDDPSKWAMGFLRSLGITLTVQSKRVEGKVTRSYTLSTEDIQSKSAAEQDRLSGRAENLRSMDLSQELVESMLEGLTL